jgi:hypothetical protein
VAVEKSPVGLAIALLKVMCHFSLGTFNICHYLCLSAIFLPCSYVEFSWLGICKAFWIFGLVSFISLRKNSQFYFYRYCSISSHFFSFWDSKYIHLNILVSSISVISSSVSYYFSLSKGSSILCCV